MITGFTFFTEEPEPKQDQLIISYRFSDPCCGEELAKWEWGKISGKENIWPTKEKKSGEGKGGKYIDREGILMVTPTTDKPVEYRAICLFEGQTMEGRDL